ncbi:hypothetical protein L9F63_003970, partial [Diploptera punctata]
FRATRIHQFQNTITKLGQENETLRKQLCALEAAGGGEVQNTLLERLQALEAENCNLTRDAELQRRQYERCLDDVANQVVRALLSQKGLREEIGALQRRIKELEAQNRALASVLVQQLHQGSPTTPPLESVPSAGALFTSLKTAALVDPSVLWLPLQRPRSLNLQLHNTSTGQQHRRNRPLIAHVADEGSESPESGNRDEGYSTMSSDVQATANGEVNPRRGLEDLKEVTDETDLYCTGRLLVVEDACDPDVLYIPLGLALGLSAGNPRHSFPPSRDLLPYQHIMRSFSDSHLCLKITTTTPSPSPVNNHQHSSYSLSSTASSSPSVLVLDVLTSARCWWDADYVQHWLRLDETRSALQQQHRDLMELEYDQTELEDWSMSLSCEDITSSAAPTPLGESLTPGQPQYGMMLPSIQENNALELEEDSSECLWNNASYLLDHRNGGSELMSLLMDDSDQNVDSGADQKTGWPYGNTNGGSCNGQGGYHENSSKRSSAAMSGCSDDAGSSESPAVIGTDFTRDFYRLVKFESTKSLASTSSRSLAGVPYREQALQSVLNFIAEQQQYCASREEQDSVKDYNKTTSSTDAETETKELSDLTQRENVISDNNTRESISPDHTCQHSGESISKTEARSNPMTDCCTTLEDRKKTEEQIEDLGSRNTEEFEEQIHTIIKLDTIDQVYTPSLEENEIQNTSNKKGRCSEVKLNEQNSSTTRKLQNNNNKEVPDEHIDSQLQAQRDDQVNLIIPSDVCSGEVLVTVIEEEDEHVSSSLETSSCREMTESMTSTVSTPDTVISTTNRRLQQQLSSSSDLSVSQTSMAGSVASTNSVIVADSRAVSFHERATSKDVIDELNRMIRKGEEAMGAEGDVAMGATKLDQACCCPTGWVHVERDIDFTDPKARANLLDVMLASSGSSGASSNSSSSSDSGDEPADYQHLHRLHRFRRQKKGVCVFY